MDQGEVELWLGLVYICMCRLLLFFVFVVVVVKIMVHTGIYTGGGKLLPDLFLGGGAKPLLPYDV